MRGFRTPIRAEANLVRVTEEGDSFGWPQNEIIRTVTGPGEIMKILLIALSLAAVAIVPTVASAADGTTTTKPAMECCNTTCPVCDMAVNTSVAPTSFKPNESTKIAHPASETAMVGFCSEKCKTAYSQDPGKYNDKILPQWQKSRENQKGTSKGS